MIAPLKPSRRSSTAVWHAKFQAMLPVIVTHARISFRHFRPEAREEAIQEVVCNACAATARLAELGKLDLAYPTVLARYGVAQFRDGRKVGCRLNIRDVLSPYCQQRKNLTVERLDKFDDDDGAWQEIIVEDQTATPADIARVRIDFDEWLQILPRQQRKVANTLALGETTSATAKKFGLSAGRISQLRRDLMESWQAFVGDEPSPAVD